LVNAMVGGEQEGWVKGRAGERRQRVRAPVKGCGLAYAISNRPNLASSQRESRRFLNGTQSTPPPGRGPGFHQKSVVDRLVESPCQDRKIS